MSSFAIRISATIALTILFGAASAQGPPVTKHPDDVIYLGDSAASLPEFEVDSGSRQGHQVVLRDFEFCGETGTLYLKVGPWSRRVTSEEWVGRGFDSSAFIKALNYLTSKNGPPEEVRVDAKKNVKPYLLPYPSVDSSDRPPKWHSDVWKVQRWQWESNRRTFKIKLLGVPSMNLFGYNAQVF